MDADRGWHGAARPELEDRVDMALPAFLASLVAPRPPVEALFDSVEILGLGSVRALRTMLVPRKPLFPETWP